MHRAESLSFIDRFRATTRGQIVDLLRCRPMTTDELAGELGLTNKAVRAHLASLEVDGFVRHHSRRRSGKAGQPAVVYEFQPDAARFFCSGYTPVLVATLDILNAAKSTGTREAKLRQVGEELASTVQIPRTHDVAERLRVLTSLLDSWGGVPIVEKADGKVVIRSCGCPISAAVKRHPDACLILETMIARVLGVPVRERCDRSGHPACLFDVFANTKPRIPAPAHPRPRKRR